MYEFSHQPHNPRHVSGIQYSLVHIINFQGKCCAVPAGCLISRQAQEQSETKKQLGRVPGSSTVKKIYLIPKFKNVHSLSNHCGPNMCLALGIRGKVGNVPSCPLG